MEIQTYHLHELPSIPITTLAQPYAIACALRGKGSRRVRLILQNLWGPDTKHGPIQGFTLVKARHSGSAATTTKLNPNDDTFACCV